MSFLGLRIALRNPLHGNWKLAEYVEDGKVFPAGDRDRYFVTVRGSLAEVGYASICGTCGDDIYAQGKMVRVGSRIKIHRRIRMTPEFEKVPCGELIVLKGERLEFDWGGRQLIFRRSEHQPSILDWLPWV